MYLLSKLKVLFILDKWCAGNKNSGISEWETNIWKSLESTGLADVVVFHFDEYRTLHIDPDSAVIALCEAEKPDYICLVLYRPPGSHHTVPTFKTLDILSIKLNIPIMTIWGDLQGISTCRVADTVTPYTKLNVYTALLSGTDLLKNKSNFYYAWVPKDQRIFRDFNITRDIQVAYIGSSRPERIKAVKFLHSNNIDVFRSGGEREKHLTTEEYCRLLNQTQINLSFARSGVPEVDVVNARVFETMLCGTMLLQQESKETEYFYTPFVDYVLYNSHIDMLEKIKYYIEHTDERIKIAASGRDKTKRLYSAKRFWKKVFSTLKELTK